MTTLAIATWHARPQLLEDQIATYNAAFDGDITHLININSDYVDSFWAEARKMGIDFKKYGNLKFLAFPVRTYYAGVAHAFFEAVQEALRLNLNFSYIYWHTASDLMVKAGAHKYIANYDIGFGRSPGVELGFGRDHRGIELPKFEVDNPSDWLAAISADHQITPVLKAMNLPKLHKSRCEGAFFSRDVFFELMYPLTSNLSIAQMASPPKPYPLEEYIFAQCVEFYCQRHAVRRAPHLVHTSASENNRATIADIEMVIESSDKFGVKRFSSDLRSEERNMIRRSLGIPELEPI